MHLYLFNEESRASTYGVGTYLRQVIEALRWKKWLITVIELGSTKTTTLLKEKIDEIEYLYIGMPKLISIRSQPKYSERYYRRVLLLLQTQIKSENIESVFHFQQLCAADLVIGLKIRYPQFKVVSTVHYMNWSFSLLGDKIKLKEILSHPEENINKSCIESIIHEKRFLDECDNIIAIARHSYDSLREIYQIPCEKLILIPNGLKDEYTVHTKKERKIHRAKYGFKDRDKILIYAGRIDPVKGCDLLAETFTKLVPYHKDLRLIIAGEGNSPLTFEKIKPYWSKVSQIGFVDKVTLYELYSIADIGVLPSLHEEFGYVALEMMMMGLPLVVNKTTGLKETVIDGETGFVVPISEKNEMINDLEKAIERLLHSSLLRKTFRAHGRKRYMEIYETKIFQQVMGNFYQRLLLE